MILGNHAKMLFSFFDEVNLWRQALLPQVALSSFLQSTAHVLWNTTFRKCILCEQKGSVGERLFPIFSFAYEVSVGLVRVMP